jgi:hypothetical protein
VEDQEVQAEAEEQIAQTVQLDHRHKIHLLVQLDMEMLEELEQLQTGQVVEAAEQAGWELTQQQIMEELEELEDSIV